MALSPDVTTVVKAEMTISTVNNGLTKYRVIIKFSEFGYINSVVLCDDIFHINQISYLCKVCSNVEKLISTK